MLLELFDSIRAWQERLPVGRARLVVVFFVLAGSALAGVGMLTWDSVPPLAVTAGGLAGALWLVAAHISWWRFMPNSMRERLDLRALLNLQQRRLVGGVAAVSWLLLMAVVGRAAGVLGSAVVLVGAVNVVVLVTIAHVVVASPREREEWTEQQEEMWRQRAYARAVEKGLVPPPGHPATGEDGASGAPEAGPVGPPDRRYGRARRRWWGRR